MQSYAKFLCISLSYKFELQKGCIQTHLTMKKQYFRFLSTTNGYKCNKIVFTDE